MFSIIFFKYPLKTLIKNVDLNYPWRELLLVLPPGVGELEVSVSVGETFEE
jgi:hypothetical protein